MEKVKKKDLLGKIIKAREKGKYKIVDKLGCRPFKFVECLRVLCHEKSYKGIFTIKDGLAREIAHELNLFYISRSRDCKPIYIEKDLEGCWVIHSNWIEYLDLVTALFEVLWTEGLIADLSEYKKKSRKRKK